MALVTTRQKQSLIGYGFLGLLILIIASLPYTITDNILLSHGVSKGAANAWGWVAEVVIYGIPLVLLLVWVQRNRNKSPRR